MKKSHLFLLFLSLTLFTSTIVKSNTMEFTLAINRPEEESYAKWVKLVYTEIFKRLDIKLNIEYLPIKRSSIHAQAGIVDGESGRIYTYGDYYSNLIRIEEHVFTMSVNAYTNNKNLRLKHWRDLNNQNFRIDYPRGMVIIQTNLKKYVNNEKYNTVNETFQGLEKLLRNRNEIYIDDHNSVLSVLKSSKNRFKNKIYVAGIMEEVKLYMYIHKKNASLKVHLEKVIKDIKKENIIEKFRKEVFEN